MKASVARYSFFLFLLVVLAVPAVAQIGLGPFAAFPTDNEVDGRMLSFGCAGVATFEEDLSITLSVPAEESEFTLSIFDGDTRKNDTNGVHHWDTGSRQLIYTLYFDPLGQGNTNPADQVAVWYGNDPNPTTSPSSDPNKQWTTTSATMPDNAWWGATIYPAAPALSPSGNYFYHLTIATDGSCNVGEALATNFKLAGLAPLSFLVPRFGFEASLRAGLNDANILYENLNVANPLASPSTYDGTFDFFLQIDERIADLRLYGGDFDHGTRPGPLTGQPSGVMLQECVDTDDPDTDPLYLGFPFNPIGALPEGAKIEGGNPPDDNRIDIFRRGEPGDPNRVGCVRYELRDPVGNVYRNDNPSGNLEWEQFRVVSDLAVNPALSDYQVPGDTLPTGIWTVHTVGLDLSNLNFWYFEAGVCSNQDGQAACPPKVFVLGDTVFLDANGNGVQDPGEAGIPGVIVNLYRDTSMPPVKTVVTGDASNPDWAECVRNNTGADEDGLYCFGLNNGDDYTVEIAPENFEAGGALAGYSSTTGGETQLDTLVDDNVLTYDFGYVAYGSIGDRVWLDEDGDGVQDGGEAGINGVTVSLLDGDGNVVATTTTSGDGDYLFEGLLAGDYTVQIDAGTLPPGVQPSYDLDGTGTANTASLTLGEGENRTDVDFGYAYFGSIGDRVWLDTDADGVQDAGELGINGVTVFLIDGDGNVIASAVTSGDGNYSFGSLPAGSYTVSIDSATLPAGVQPSYDLDGTGTPHTADVTLGVGEDRTDVDFGYYEPGSIGDRVWNDLDADGEQDGGEPGINGVTVRLLDGDGNVIATTVTSGDGNYLFENLPPGTYTVEVDASTLPSGYTGTYDLDGLATANRATVTLAGGEDRTDVDFGYAQCGACDGKVTRLTLQYLGDSPATIEVRARRGKSKNEVVYSGVVAPGESFTVVGPASGNGGFYGTLGTEINIYVDGDHNAFFHTSCSQPIGPGSMDGDFVVVAGASKNNGPLCPTGGGGGDEGSEQCAVGAPVDPYGSSGGHALWMPGIDTQLVFEPDPGTFTEYADGTATLSGHAVRAGDAGTGFDVSVTLSGYTETAPAGSPKKELASGAYAENGGPVDTSTFTYYTTFSGTLTGFGNWAGASLTITRVGPAFQVGEGANNKNVGFGASAWFTWQVTSQPNGGYLQPTGQGDFNLDLGQCSDGGDGGGDPPSGADGTGTIGYWKNHPEAWPSSSIVIGGRLYTRDEAILLMASPGGGDKTYDLFAQLVAAQLNVDVGNASECIDDVLYYGHVWLYYYPPGSNVKASSWAWKKSGDQIHSYLDAYNNGQLCAPHRG